MWKLIELDEALDFAEYFHYWMTNMERWEVEEEFNKRNIKTIDIVWEIEKMIEGITDNLKTWTTRNLEFTDLVAQKYVLERLLQKFKS